VKRNGPAKWDPRPPNVRERIIAGIWLFAFIAAMSNYYAGWQLLGGLAAGLPLACSWVACSSSSDCQV
jgi:hypothetical protein